MKHSKKEGQGFLALVILIGGVILAGGVAITLITISYLDSTAGFQDAEQAETIATAGVEDGLLQLARNNIFSSPSGYTLPVGSSTALVTVNQSTPSSGYATILSVAIVSGRTRKVSVVVGENASTGQSTIVSWTDVQ